MFIVYCILQCYILLDFPDNDDNSKNITITNI